MYGVIDIGSNTIKLSVYKMTNNSLRLIFNNKNIAGLVAYVDKEGFFSEKGIKKIITVLKSYKQILENVKVKDVFVIATASLRNIQNSEEVLKKINEFTGYQVDLISGEEEAIYDFIGATHAMELNDGIMVDIGGGSTELVFYKNKKIEKALSMPIGSLNMFYRHVNNIMPTDKELEKIKATVKDELRKIDINEDYQIICGVGGTIRALCKMNNDIYEMPITNRTIEVENIKEMLDKFAGKRRYAIKKIVRLAPDRIHTLIPGMAILVTIAKRYNSVSIVVSKHGVKEGYLFKKLCGEYYDSAALFK